MPAVNGSDVARMRDQLFVEGAAGARKLSRFWLLLVLSGVIATAGVVADSTATVIGAMIVAPLMTPILGIVLAVVLGDRVNLLRSVVLVVAGAAAVVAIAWAMGHLVSLSVVADTNSQVAGRVQPRLIDLVAALATGAVGSVALARSDISDTLPGVAIAISLVPPLAVVGLTLESGATGQAAGALLLFATNVSAILFSGVVVMSLFRVAEVAAAAATTPELERARRRRAFVLVAASVVVVAVPLTLTSRRITTDALHLQDVTAVATDWAERDGWRLLEAGRVADGYRVRAAGPLPEPRPDSLRRALDRAGLDDVPVELELVPERRITLDPAD
jgi:uncharacterized hydrophobic protein (TIGR00271 family)